jgi:hypothetical protein
VRGLGLDDLPDGVQAHTLMMTIMEIIGDHGEQEISRLLRIKTIKIAGVTMSESE